MGHLFPEKEHSSTLQIWRFYSPMLRTKLRTSGGESPSVWVQMPTSSASTSTRFVAHQNSFSVSSYFATAARCSFFVVSVFVRAPTRTLLEETKMQRNDLMMFVSGEDLMDQSVERIF